VDCRWADQEILHSKISPKIMIAHYQITYRIPWLPCKQLSYPPEHPRISRIRQRDKSEIPLPTLSYNYFLGTLSPSCHPSSPKLISLTAALSKSSRTEQNLPQQSLKSSIFFFLGKKWPSTSSSLRLIYSHPSLFSLQPFTFCESTYLAFFFFFLSLYSFNLRILGTERENCYFYRTTPSSIPRSTGWPRSYRFDKCGNQ
jgi:hypothetical protein